MNRADRRHRHLAISGKRTRPTQFPNQSKFTSFSLEDRQKRLLIAPSNWPDGSMKTRIQRFFDPSGSNPFLQFSGPSSRFGTLARRCNKHVLFTFDSRDWVCKFRYPPVFLVLSVGFGRSPRPMGFSDGVWSSWTYRFSGRCL